MRLQAKFVWGFSNGTIGVWGFFNNAGDEGAFGRYITSKFPIYLAQDEALEVIDRRNLNFILKENNLSAEGLIDNNTIKELGKIKALDLIILGNFWVFDDKIELNLIILDTERATYTCSSEAFLPLDDNMYSLLGIRPPNSDKSSVNRGFNRPLNSNEVYNDPTTVSEECEEKGFGDFCFSNQTQQELSGSLESRRVTLKPGQTQCYYSRISGRYRYTIRTVKEGIEKGVIYQGEVMIEKCRSKTYVIDKL